MKQKIKLSLIDGNSGQIEGVKSNPRTIKDAKYKKLLRSLKDDPELLEHRGLLVFPFKGRFVAIGGNMRLKAMREIGHPEAWCEVIDGATSTDKLNAYTIKDNSGFGDWDWDGLSDGWGMTDLEMWGLDLPTKKQTEVLSQLKYEPIYYEPKDIPNIKLLDCVDLRKFEAKIKAIDKFDLTDKQKKVLQFFAYRFIKIDFEGVANYYAFNATEQERKAIERLRLVLTDDGIDGFIGDDMIKVMELLNEEND